MKNILLIISSILLSISANAQMLNFNVSGMYKKSLPNASIHQAKSLSDINPGYPKSWLSESDYISTEMKIIREGESSIAKGKNENLSAHQIQILGNARIGDEVEITVQYYRENAATKEREIRTMNYVMTVTPDVEAEYVGGFDSLREYIKSNAIDKIRDLNGKEVESAVVRFTVNENGHIVHITMYESSSDERVDAILQNALDAMPHWRPAHTANGKKVQQDFELRVGSLVGC